MAIRTHPESRTMKVADLTGAPYNPRTISDEAMKGLSASIERFGLVQPIVWNRRTERVVGGHQRLKVLVAQRRSRRRPSSSSTSPRARRRR